MAESADEVYARVTAAAGPDGRLPLPSVAGWDVFPWEVDDGRLVPKRLSAPAPEEPRFGEAPDKPCGTCAGDHDARVIWENQRWTVSHQPQSGLPLVVMLQTREHLDFNELDDDLAGECGRLQVWLVRIIERLPHVRRCHVHRIGDGGSHCHVWFMARTEGLPSTRGSFAVDWDDILPPGPEDLWRADLAEVARKLATHDGRALV